MDSIKCFLAGSWASKVNSCGSWALSGFPGLPSGETFRNRSGWGEERRCLAGGRQQEDDVIGSTDDVTEANSSPWGTAILTGFPRSKMSEWMLLLQLPTLAHQPDLAVRAEPRAGLCLRQERRAGGIVPPHLYSHPWNVCPRC